MQVTFELNGVSRRVDVEGDTPLLWVLRDDLQQTGTRFGCGRAMCGACTVHVEGQTVRACSFPIRYAEGKKVTTIEGVEQQDEVAQAVVEAWIMLDVVQCGWCQPGQVMSATALLREKSEPSDKDIDGAIAGNICRCGTYPRIRDAIKLAAKGLNHVRSAAGTGGAR